MKPKDLKPEDCATVGLKIRKHAIAYANFLTNRTSEQHNVIKINNLWHAYNAVKHH